jgi:hypothetical protein
MSPASSSSTSGPSGTAQPGTQPGKKTLSFRDFMRQKEHDRQSRFEPKSKKSKPNSSKGKEKECDVNISIGYMKVDNDGNLKRCRGKTLPIRVSPGAGRSEILDKAVRKHANHDKNVVGELEHVLMNGDGNEITTLPGTEKEFVLREYKDEIGKNYNRITLFIALRSAYMYAEVSKLKMVCADSESESESDTDNGARDVKGKVAVRSSPGSNKKSSGDTNILEQMPLPVSASNPSTSNPSTESHDQGQDVLEVICKEQLIECPTCLQYFSIDKIAEHADMCCDIWVGSVINHAYTSSEESSSPHASPRHVTPTQDITDVKESILQIKAATLSDKVVRLNIRRTYMWSDFKESRSDGKVSPTDQVKIVFVGESAIDDGGPKREFFSGTLYIFCNCV